MAQLAQTLLPPEIWTLILQIMQNDSKSARKIYDTTTSIIDLRHVCKLFASLIGSKIRVWFVLNLYTCKEQLKTLSTSPFPFSWFFVDNSKGTWYQFIKAPHTRKEDFGHCMRALAKRKKVTIKAPADLLSLFVQWHEEGGDLGFIRLLETRWLSVQAIHQEEIPWETFIKHYQYLLPHTKFNLKIEPHDVSDGVKGLKYYTELLKDQTNLERLRIEVSTEDKLFTYDELASVLPMIKCPFAIDLIDYVWKKEKRNSTVLLSKAITSSTFLYKLSLGPSIHRYVRFGLFKEALCTNTSIIDLDLTQKWPNEEIAVVVEILRRNKILKKLHLSNLGLDEDNRNSAFVKAICENKTLETLSLYNCPFIDFEDVVSIIAKNKTLSTFCVQGDKEDVMVDDDVNGFKEAVLRNTTLRWLDLERYNFLMEDRAVLRELRQKRPFLSLYPKYRLCKKSKKRKHSLINGV